MLQTFENTRPYAQPLSPIEVRGTHYALPTDFVNGLALLRLPLKSRGNEFERQVGLLAGKLYVLTTSLVVEYDAGSLEIPDFWFSPDLIRTLEAFDVPPTEVYVDGINLFFRWQDGQEFFVRSRNLMPGRTHRQMADKALAYYQPFTEGVEITTRTRRDLRRMHGEKKLAADLFITQQEIVSRMSSDGKRWTSETATPFLSNADRTMRFDRKAFLDMIRIADEIDFSTSPVSFQHAHGRGVLVERTLGSDTPTFGVADD